MESALMTTEKQINRRVLAGAAVVSLMLFGGITYARAQGDAPRALDPSTVPITEQQARATAAKTTGAQADTVKLEGEAGRAVYTVRTIQPSGDSTEVRIDATTGAVLAPEDGERDGD
jgi:uncharacterized membrane protein YkoI